MNHIKSATILKAILSLMACYGIFMAVADAKGWASTKVADFIFSVGTLALAYLWYYLDAAERGFRRTSAMGASIILFTLVALPVYLIRSRPKGERFKSIGALLLFMLACLIVAILAALPVSMALA